MSKARNSVAIDEFELDDLLLSILASTTAAPTAAAAAAPSAARSHPSSSKRSYAEELEASIDADIAFALQLVEADKRQPTASKKRKVEPPAVKQPTAESSSSKKRKQEQEERELAEAIRQSKAAFEFELPIAPQAAFRSQSAAAASAASAAPHANSPNASSSAAATFSAESMKEAAAKSSAASSSAAASGSAPSSAIAIRQSTCLTPRVDSSGCQICELCPKRLNVCKNLRPFPPGKAGQTCIRHSTDPPKAPKPAATPSRSHKRAIRSEPDESTPAKAALEFELPMESALKSQPAAAAAGASSAKPTVAAASVASPAAVVASASLASSAPAVSASAAADPAESLSCSICLSSAPSTLTSCCMMVRVCDSCMRDYLSRQSALKSADRKCPNCNQNRFKKKTWSKAAVVFGVKL